MASEISRACGVLVVEDDPSIRRLVRLLLEREGYCVEVASDGIEAVLKLGVCEYDVIILDLMMPNLDGFALIDTLRQSQPERLRRIIVTSAASPAVIRDRIDGLPFDILPKPFDTADLVARVGRCAQAQRS